MATDEKKNIIIIKNLPSNLIEEAIVVVKNKKDMSEINSLDIIKGCMSTNDFEKIKKIKEEQRDYVVKEAELVLSDYIRKIEDNKEYKTRKKTEKMYYKVRYINFVLIAVSILSMLICIVK